MSKMNSQKLFEDPSVYIVKPNFSAWLQITMFYGLIDELNICTYNHCHCAAVWVPVWQGKHALCLVWQQWG